MAYRVKEGEALRQAVAEHVDYNFPDLGQKRQETIDRMLKSVTGLRKLPSRSVDYEENRKDYADVRDELHGFDSAACFSGIIWKR